MRRAAIFLRKKNAKIFYHRRYEHHFSCLPGLPEFSILGLLQFDYCLFLLLCGLIDQ